MDLEALTWKMLYVAFHSVGETVEEGIKIHNYYVIHEISWHMHTHIPYSLRQRTTLSQLKCYKTENSHYPANVRDSPINYRDRQTACRIPWSWKRRSAPQHRT